MGIQINGQTDTIKAIDGTMTMPGTVTYEDVSRINVVGVVTAASFNSTGEINIKGTQPTIELYEATDTYGWDIFRESADARLKFRYDDGGSISIPFTITPTSRIGIGTTNPSTGLHLLGADAYFTMQGSQTDSNAGILFKDSVGVQNSVILYDFDNDYLKFSTSTDAEALRITSNGRVEVKSSAESLRLEPSTTADTSYMGFRSNTSHYGFLGAANQLITSGAATDLALRAQGNLILSVSTTPILKVQSSQVIAFKSSIVESGSSLGNAAGSGVELFNLGATNRAYIARGFVVGYGSNADISFEITGVTGGTVTVLHTTTIAGSGSNLSFSSASNGVTVQNGVYNANVYLTMLEYMPNDVTS